MTQRGHADGTGRAPRGPPGVGLSPIGILGEQRLEGRAARGRTAAARRAACFALALIVLSTSTGCVYWRLFKMRRQLAAFDTHCTITHDPGAILRFAKPALKPTDVEWLLGRTAVRDGESWSYHLQKRASDGGAGDPLSTIDILFKVEKNRVREIEFPPQFNHVLDHDTLSRVFVGAETAEIEKAKHSTGWELHNELEIPRLDRVHAMLGAPTRREGTELHHVLVYEYDMEPKPQDVTEPDASGLLVFDRKEKKIIHAAIRVGALQISLSRDPIGPYRVQLQHKKS